MSNVNSTSYNNGDNGDDKTLSGRKLFKSEKSGVNENDEVANDAGVTAAKRMSAKETEQL